MICRSLKPRTQADIYACDPSVHTMIRQQTYLLSQKLRIPQDEIQSVAWMAVGIAANRFVQKGNKTFRAYARTFVRFYCFNYARDGARLVRIPRNVSLFHLSELVLRRKLGPMATEEDMAKALNLDLKDYLSLSADFASSTFTLNGREQILAEQAHEPALTATESAFLEDMLIGKRSPTFIRLNYGLNSEEAQQVSVELQAKLVKHYEEAEIGL